MKHIGLIKTLAHEHSKVSGLEMDDLIGEGYLAYLEALPNYNPEVSALSTFTTYCVSNHYTKLSRLRAKEKQPTLAEPYCCASPDPAHEGEFQNRINHLQGDARTLCKLLLGDPVQYISLPKGGIEKQMKDIGWGRARFSRAWNNLSSTVKEG